MEEVSKWDEDFEDPFSRRVRETLNTMFSAQNPPELPVQDAESLDISLAEENPLGSVESEQDVRNLEYSQFLKSINERELANVQHVTAQLTAIQQEGLKWMYWRETQQIPGGILADDMGLGKTLTALSLIMKKKETTRNLNTAKKKLTLIVCPASIIRVWKEEAYHHLEPGSLNVCVYHGKNRPTKRHHIFKYDVIVTSYEILRKEYREEGMLFTIQWDRLIIDEAHHVRNPRCVTFEALVNIGSHMNWCLTGTPLQNREEDILALLSIVGLQVRKCDLIGTPLLGEYMLHRSTEFAISNNLMGEIPTMHIHMISVKLRGRHKRLYRTAVMMVKPLFKHFIAGENYKVGRTDQYALDEACNVYTNGGAASHSVILGIIHKLLQIATHPGLLKKEKHAVDEAEKTKKKKKKKPKINKFFQVLLADCTQDIRNVFGDAEEVTEKMMKTLELVRKFVEKNEKVIIVSKFQDHLDIIANYLKNHNITDFVNISGRVPVSDRKPLYDHFQRAGSPYVLLTTLLCGNEGLTLTEAQHMIILENHWNPQQINQCMKRIHRRGQKKEAQIYMLIADPSIETTVQAVANEKERRANSYLGQGNKEALARLDRQGLIRMCNFLITEDDANEND